MNHYGHPILGDTLYGSLSVQKRSSRLCLHAFYITFIHPKTKEIMKVFSNGCEFVDQDTFDIIVSATKTDV
jgi:tRNA pseudouridine32 synthase/23S rRNA pseudouridine746 synthase